MSRRKSEKLSNGDVEAAENHTEEEVDQNDDQSDDKPRASKRAKKEAKKDKKEAKKSPRKRSASKSLKEEDEESDTEYEVIKDSSLFFMVNFFPRSLMRNWFQAKSAVFFLFASTGDAVID